MHCKMSDFVRHNKASLSEGGEKKSETYVNWLQNCAHPDCDERFGAIKFFLSLHLSSTILSLINLITVELS